MPRAKANGYEYGIHVPMAVSYPDGTLMMGVKPEDLEQILENAGGG